MSIHLDLTKTAVLSLHMINDVVLKDGKFGQIFGEQAEARKVIEKGKQLMETARSFQIPVIHIAVRFQPGYSDLVANSPLLSMVKEMNALVEGTRGGDFVEELQPLEHEITIFHQRVGPFQETELAALLNKLGIESLIIYGVATNVSVEQTARNAIDHGFQVFVVEDCCSAATLQAHQASIETLGLLSTVITLNDVTQLVKNNEGA
ncbi:cysteine hydrolase [Paenibacillus frigoriresistens]|uniref:cysteine hydrolase family protein n=1 Tax=Paenibacillus alginolyticus TaxID=59839 RepID=UPI00156504A4|nr:isochorismatase family cysteine hydrolase [Paenibacillus frigoriresistens]NRF94389.1 cysteine hydrolase [Paenibacillus frigoriresistens]NRF94394.1 cysteine hydrolase [Paenibacillus frigoriresistens]